MYAVFRRRSDERTLTEVLNGAFVDDPFEHIVSGYPEALRSLVRAVEVKDTYTHGHSQRTARHGGRARDVDGARRPTSCA